MAKIQTMHGTLLDWAVKSVGRGWGERHFYADAEGGWEALEQTRGWLVKGRGVHRHRFRLTG